MSSRTQQMKFYEGFAVLHKLLFIGFMVGIYRHCDDFGWMPWVYLTIAIYTAERAARLVKIGLSGVKNQATFTIIYENVVRISVNSHYRMWNPKPGNFVYIRILTYNLFWQAHPFTVFESPLATEQGNLQMVVKVKDGATKTLKK